jgi:hypothetical protein
VSERRACSVLGQPRGTQRYERRVREDEERLVQAVVDLSSEYGRYGYRTATGLPQQWISPFRSAAPQAPDVR